MPKASAAKSSQEKDLVEVESCKSSDEMPIAKESMKANAKESGFLTLNVMRVKYNNPARKKNSTAWMILSEPSGKRPGVLAEKKP